MYEGPPDRTLVECLGVKFTKDGRHKSGVLKELAQTKKMIGILDQDPKNTQSRPKTMDEFILTENKRGIKSYYHQSNSNQLIVICPNLESWILKASKTSKIEVTTYNLPGNPSTLHRIINNRLPNFERLIRELVAQKNPSILYLQRPTPTLRLCSTLTPSSARTFAP